MLKRKTKICRERVFYLIKRFVPLSLNKNHSILKNPGQSSNGKCVPNWYSYQPAPVLPHCLHLVLQVSDQSTGKNTRKCCQVVQRHWNVTSTHLRDRRTTETECSLCVTTGINKRQRLKNNNFLKFHITNLQRN